MDDAPLILTLRFDADSFAHFDRMRRQYFPPARNFIPAHLTLFHHLPGARHAEVAAAVAEKAAGIAPFAIAVSGLRFLGQGTAYALESTQLAALRAGLAADFADTLTRQDAQGYRPHVTIQNKCSAAAARQTFDALTDGFAPFEVTATGLLLWHYRGGPWEAAGEFAFAG